MELKIKGRNAIVCASSKGLGRGCAKALAREGVNVVINGRNADEVAKTAAEIRAESRVLVTEVVADVSTSDGRAKLLQACSEPDILINNAGGPPPCDFRDLDEAAWLEGLSPNLIAPIMLIRATIDGMIERKFGRIVNITSRSVKTPLLHLPVSNVARAGLTAFVAGLARQVAVHNVIINGLLPGPFDTERQRGPMKVHAEKAGVTIDEWRANLKAQIPAGRFGNEEEFGSACAYLCSDKVGFMVGQNLLLDGGGFYSTV